MVPLLYGHLANVRGQAERIRADIESVDAWHSLQEMIMQFNNSLQSNGFPQEWNYSVDIFQDVFGLTMPFDPKYFFSGIDFEGSSSADFEDAREELRKTISRPGGKQNIKVAAWVQTSAGYQVFAVHEYDEKRMARLKSAAEHTFDQQSVPRVGWGCRDRFVWKQNRF